MLHRHILMPSTFMATSITSHPWMMISRDRSIPLERVGGENIGVKNQIVAEFAQRLGDAKRGATSVYFAHTSEKRWHSLCQVDQ